MANSYTVTQINSYIKNVFRQDFVLNKVSVRGEISNCKYHTSGHVYFTLKDEAGTLSAIMFAQNAAKLTFRMENGMQVIVTGRVDVYERDGKYQLYATNVEHDGIGDLYLKYEELKQSYEQMGYFAAMYKKQIPAFAQKVGIVTASTGAAIHDICNISYRRNPYVSLVLYPALVQGKDAADSIARGIESLDKMKLDVLIVGRGGGSIEDLWAFNEEPVIEAVFNATTPIISAVGHETDFTIADFVADRRASTPSEAAELAVCDIRLIEERISAYNQLLNNALYRLTESKRMKLETLQVKLSYLNPVNMINDKRMLLDRYNDRLVTAINSLLYDRKHVLSLYASKLDGLSPLKKLQQGYAYVENSDGNMVNSVRSVNIGDTLLIHMKDGKIKAKVEEEEYGKVTGA